jgi:hypothetical protein
LSQKSTAKSQKPKAKSQTVIDITFTALIKGRDFEQ